MPGRWGEDRILGGLERKVQVPSLLAHSVALFVQLPYHGRVCFMQYAFERFELRAILYQRFWLQTYCSRHLVAMPSLVHNLMELGWPQGLLPTCSII